MRRFGKALMIVVGVVAVLIVLLVVVVPLVVPADRVRDLVKDRIEVATGGEVTLGEAQVRVFPRIRVVLGEANVTGTGADLAAATGQPSPVERYSAAVKRLEVDLALWPLLQRRVEVGSIRLVEPDVEVVTAPAADEPRSPGAQPSERGPEAEGGGYGLVLAAVAIEDGRLLWQDRASGQTVTVAGWDQELRAPNLDALMRLMSTDPGSEAPADGEAAALAVDGQVDELVLESPDRPQPLRLALVGYAATASVPPAADLMVLEDVRVTWGPWELEGSAELRPLPDGGWQVDSLAVVAEEQAVALAGRLRTDGAGLSGRLRGTVELEQAWPAVRATTAELVRPGLADSLPAVTGAVEWRLALDGFGGQAGGGDGVRAEPGGAATGPFDFWRTAAPGAIELEARARDLAVMDVIPASPWRTREAELTGRSPEPLRASVSGIDHPALAADAQFRVIPRPGGEWPHLDVEVTAEHVDVDRLRELMAATETASAGTEFAFPPAGPSRAAAAAAADLLAVFAPAARAQAGAGEIPPGAAIPVELTMDFRGQARTAVMQKLEFQQVRIAGQLQRKVITVETLRAERGGGAIVGSGSVDYAADPWGVMEFVAELEGLSTSAVFEPFAPAVAQQWEGLLSGRAAGGARLADDPLAMLASLDLEGVISSSDGVYHAQELLAGIRRYLGDRTDLQEIRYTELVQHFRVQDGRYHVDDLRVDGRDTDWTGSGWVSFDGDLNLDLQVKLPPGFTPDLGQASFLAEGLRDEDGRITLNLAVTGPARSPEVGLDLSGARARAQEDLQQKLEDEARKGVGGLLDKLKGK
ncbi:MAG: AsmA-like C-terminal region-containing protein [Candidatus Krumholzibacteriia bacterium]